jgi:putative hydrolase of the HAD superfamily
MEDRHHLIFDTYQAGELTLEDNSGRVVFYQRRAFTWAQVRRFMLR